MIMFNCMKKLDETSLPPKEAFYSKLTGDGITYEDYQHAHTVLKEFNIESMKDYQKLYNLSDVLLLADIFENFRNICTNHYGLDQLGISVHQVLLGCCIINYKGSTRIIKRPRHVVNDLKWYQRRNRNNISPSC